MKSAAIKRMREAALRPAPPQTEKDGEIITAILQGRSKPSTRRERRKLLARAKALTCWWKKKGETRA